MNIDSPRNLIPELANALTPSTPSLVHVDAVHKTTAVVVEVEEGAPVLLQSDALLFHLSLGGRKYAAQLAVQSVVELAP